MKTATPQEPSRFGRLRFTRRSAAIVVALLMIAAPAGASVIVQNFMEADIDPVAACFAKVGGDDTDDILSPADLADFNGSTTDVVDGVNVLEERIDLDGMIGDRVIYTDVVRYQNNCGQSIDVSLSTTGVTGTWTNLHLEMWISNVQVPANIDPNLDGPGGDWNDNNISVDDPYVQDSTGTVTVADGAEIRGAFIVTSDVNFVGGDAPVVNWVAQATLS